MYDFFFHNFMKYSDPLPSQLNFRDKEVNLRLSPEPIRTRMVLIKDKNRKEESFVFFKWSN